MSLNLRPKWHALLSEDLKIEAVN